VFEGALGLVDCDGVSELDVPKADGAVLVAGDEEVGVLEIGQTGDLAFLWVL
jgi:hypothetical protein